MVITHAPMMLPATPQRTADSRRVAPTPITAEVIVCVVEIGAWNTYAVVYRTDAATDSAAKPRGGSRSTIRRPKVRMMRQPRSEEHTSELQSRGHLVCRLLLEKKNK